MTDTDLAVHNLDEIFKTRNILQEKPQNVDENPSDKAQEDQTPQNEKMEKDSEDPSTNKDLEATGSADGSDDIEKSGTEKSEKEKSGTEKSGNEKTGEEKSEGQESNSTKKMNETAVDSNDLSKPKENCTPAAIEQFPKPLMSKTTRKNGGLIIHILVTIYMFVAIAIICDDFFVPSLEIICDRLRLSENVAGATFMAAGSSAPELSTAIIAVFITKDDIGISGVIGSAVFNILFVISVCGLFAGHVLCISWWPLMRDCFFYSISIVGMLICIYNNEVTWYDALFLLFLYGVYIAILMYDQRMEAWVSSWNIPFKTSTRAERSSLFSGPIKPNGTPGNGGTGPEEHPMWEENVQNDEQNQPSESNIEIDSAQRKSMAPEKKDEDVDIWEMPVGVYERFKWTVSLPLVALHFVTVPDARTPRWQRWYVVTFIMSLVWISIYSYLMVWMITVIGFTLSIPDTVMGLTFVAVGVSVPDALSSLCVAKQGYGDMAVSNAIGSNVFDILICLGLPWFIKTAITEPGSVVKVKSRGLTYSTISLFSTVIFLIAVTHWNRWKLDFKYGIILMVWYIIFMIFSSLSELNVFGDVGHNVCPSNY